MVSDLVNGRTSPKSNNWTYIVLIQKVPNPKNVSQFRLISLCNYLYKIVTKVLAICLKPLLLSIFSSSQSAFVAGRQIQDNILIAQEVFHFLKLRKAKGMFELALKIDMNKAYDRLEWDFLEAIMTKMGFDLNWINLIMGYVSTVEFLVLVNGQPGNKFYPSRRLTQGGPISLYLFLIVSEVLSWLIHCACESSFLEEVKLSPHALPPFVCR